MAICTSHWTSINHSLIFRLGCCLMQRHVVLHFFQVAIRTTHWTAINHGLIWGTLALWLPFLALLQGLCGSVPSLNPLCGLGPELLGSAGFWLGAVLGAPAVALLADYTIMVFQRQVAPRASQLLQVGGGVVAVFVILAAAVVLLRCCGGCWRVSLQLHPGRFSCCRWAAGQLLLFLRCFQTLGSCCCLSAVIVVGGYICSCPPRASQLLQVCGRHVLV